MDNVNRIVKTAIIATYIVNFLLNTSRVLKAIELCKECLILLNEKYLKNEKKLFNSVYVWIWVTMLNGYYLIDDHTNGLDCCRKLLEYFRGRGERFEEGTIAFYQAKFHHRHREYEKAKEFYKKALGIMIETGERQKEATCHTRLGNVYQALSDYGKAEQHHMKALMIAKEVSDLKGEANCYENLGTIYQFLGKYGKAEECHKSALEITKKIGNKTGETNCYRNLGIICQSLSKYDKAEKYQTKALLMTKGTGDHAGEASCYGSLGVIYHSLGEYGKAEEYQNKALMVFNELGVKEGVAACYGNLGTVYKSLGRYGRAEEYLKKALIITRETGDRRGEAACCGNLAAVYGCLGEYGKAKEYHKKALIIRKEIGDREGEGTCYGNLGTVYQSLGEYGNAEENHKKALVIIKEIGDRDREATCYSNLGIVYQFLGEYGKAEEFQKKALVITKEIGHREKQAACYRMLGSLYRCLSEYGKAKESQEKALVISKEIGDKEGIASSYENLGAVYQLLGEYGEAEEHLNKALVITKEISHREGEASCYATLGTLYHSLGEYGKAEEYQKKALMTRKEIGNRGGEATCYANLGNVYLAVGDYSKAEEFQKKALVIVQDIGYKKGEAGCYRNLGCVYQSLGHYDKAEEYQSKALVIEQDIGDREGEAVCYGHLGTLFRSLGNYAKAKEYHEKALALSKEIGVLDKELTFHYLLACDVLWEGNTGALHEVFPNLLSSIRKCEEIRNFLTDNDQFKISFFDQNVNSYHLLSGILCQIGIAKEALYVIELGRARALADLMSTQYSVKHQISVNPQSWAGIERIVKTEVNCSCLYISYFSRYVFMWILKENKLVLFRQIDVNECFVNKGDRRNVNEVFSEETVRDLSVLPQGHCEDRSLFLVTPGDPARQSCQQDNMAGVRQIEEDEDENQQPVPTLAECYQIFIAPVAEFLEEPEIIIVPDPFLYKVPFAALKDENEKFLSESYRIRIVPSLTTLKLIQDSPADYHSQTGALIVGEPDVGEVLFKGRKEKLCPLPCARREAEMIGRLLGVQPLLGKQATKQAVLQSIHSVSLIHFAAHGNAERGEIALAPQSPINTTPSEEDYLLTIADISQVRLRAKLVVLSCCHTARGQIRSEGVVGIARAFLGSGARSVLVALWALEDSATEQLMSRFYEHLVRGESASESLHQAMKWMRSNGYSDLRDWAPFMLIGDSVTCDFEK